MDALSEVVAPNGQIIQHDDNGPAGAPQDSQTATEFINRQLQLEADAREALPYAFDHCTNALGALRQNIFSCLTCNPPPNSPSDSYNVAGFCYSCSIACHGEHTLVELFNRRNFTCDCGTTRLPSSSPCTLRINPATGTKGLVHSQAAADTNTYNHNFQNRFCGCGELYNAHEEKGTMFQCLGLASEQDGGCGEDWWHPECVLGLGRGWSAGTKSELNPRASPQILSSTISREDATNEAIGETTEEATDIAQPLPPGFPQEEEFEAFICYKCVNANPWIKMYAGTSGFLEPVFKSTPTHRIDSPLGVEKTLEEVNALAAETQEGYFTSKRTLTELGDNVERVAQTQTSQSSNEISRNQNRKLPSFNEEGMSTTEDITALINPPQLLTNGSVTSKKRKAEDSPPDSADCSDSKKFKIELEPKPYHRFLPSAPTEPFSLFCLEDFRDHFCRCVSCYPNLRKHPQLLEEEESYEPPLSENGEEGGQSVGTGSLLDRGEAALSNVDRVKAIEGVMVYNHLKDKVKNFLQPFADSGQVVGAEDIKAYFEKLRGDDQAIKAAGGKIITSSGEDKQDGGNREEQNGY